MSENNEITFSRWIDQVADEFEEAWKKGEPPEIGKYLAGYSPIQQQELLKELILIDLAYRHRAGETAELDAYLKRFPDLSNSDGIVNSELILQARQVVRKTKADTLLESQSSTVENDSTNFPKVIDKYQILELVGEGAFGSVYKAFDTELNRTVAIKVPRNGAFLREKDKERFQREAQSAANLNHHGIVKVYDINLDGSLPYIVSDFIQGTTLSEYLNSRSVSPREAAKLLLKIAEAIEHAHRKGIVHRDLKPGNIMMERIESQFDTKEKTLDSRPSTLDFTPHITDFGLAKSESVEFTITIDGQILGTPAYMSPEQARGESSSVDVRMDVYSLGAIFYELLTGEKPFRGTTQMVLQQVLLEQPQALRKINELIPKDLETICLKCLEKEPRLRFQSSSELVEELKRFLQGDSILSRPVGKIETLWRRCKRNPFTSGLVLLVALSLAIGTAISSYFALDAHSQKKIADKERNDAEKQKILEQLRSLRLNSRNHNGWTIQAKTLLEEARGKLSASELRDQTIATYVGIEATYEKGFGKKAGSSVAFDRNGQQLVIGGLTRSPRKQELHGDESGARVWNLKSKSLIETAAGNSYGPVAFYLDEPVELIRENDTTLVLRKVPEHKVLRKIVLPIEKKSIDEHFQWTISEDASTIAASVLHEDGSRTVWVWNVDSGKMLSQLSAKAFPNAKNVPTPEKPDARVALTSDGSLVAVGTENGQINVWKVVDGSKVASLATGQNAIQSVAFSPKPGRHRYTESQQHNPQNWMLATGDSGSNIAIWDLATETKIANCFGSQLAIYCLAFNPDGTILASGGRYSVKLWDAITGDLLFNIQPLKEYAALDYVTGLAFSPDSKTLAIAGKQEHKFVEKVHLWKLQQVGSIRSLRGLNSSIEKITFSDDGKKMAALGHNWKVGIWDTKSGMLEHLLDVPRGDFIDNAGMTFSSDAAKFAFSAGTEARLWNLEIGMLVSSWDRLPPGMQENLVFDDEGDLLLVRFETKSKAKPFADEVDRDKDPFICRVRNLLGRLPYKILAEADMEFYHISQIEFSNGGRQYAVRGTPSSKPREEVVVVFDSLSGKQLWKTKKAMEFSFDSTQRRINVRYKAEKRSSNQTRDIETGRLICEINVPSGFLGPEMKLFALPTGSDLVKNAVACFRENSADPFVTLGIDLTQHESVMDVRFDQQGNQIAWGMANGAIYFCDFSKLKLWLRNSGIDIN